MFPGADNEIEIEKLRLDFDVFDDYAEKIKAYRKKHKIKQKDLSVTLGVKEFTLRSWEQGKVKPPYHVWRLYKDLFDE